MKGSKTFNESGKRAVKTRKEHVLELKGKGLQNMNSLPKRNSVCDLILDNNNITKIEKLDAFPKLTLLSMVGNRLVRMNGVNFGKHLMSVNLSNNGIVSMEGLCWLVHLEYLDLSKNKIKRIQNVSYCTKLKHMDLSENSITDISNLKSLVQLEALFLHGNTIATLERAEEKLPEQLGTLSLSENGISDLNEVRHLSCLLNLKHFSIMNNPCVMTTPSLPGFKFRPFILSCLPSLLTLDGSAVTDRERQEAERLSRDEILSLFTFGHHLQLILYLSKTCPVPDANQISKDQSDFLDDFLQKRRMEIFGDEKNTKVTGSAFPLNNNVYNFEGHDVKTTDTLQSSGYSVLDFSENTENGSGNFLPDQESETDTLRSESRFLPVYSPLKKSPGTDQRQFQTSLSWEASPPNNDMPSLAGDHTDVSVDMPIMTEEEANKLINLAATILQSRIRGFLVRRKFDYRNFKRMYTAASKIQALWRGYYFRHCSNEGLNFKKELRIRRLQKYISTLCLVMQKSEKQHEVEKQQMLEIITLLYEKFTQLSEKVEKLESSSNESYRIGRCDESRNGLEESLHPVFLPHPRLSGNIRQREDIANTDHTSSIARGFPENVEYDLKVDSQNGTGLWEDVDIINNKKFDKNSDDDTEFHGGNVEIDHLDLRSPKQDIMEKRVTLMDQEDHTDWYKKVEINGVEEDKILDQEDDAHWDKDSQKRDDSDVEDDEECCSEGEIRLSGNGEDKTEDSHAHKTFSVLDDELPADIAAEDFIGDGTMSSEMSEAFNTANVCALLETVESDKRMEETFSNIEGLQGDSNGREVVKSVDAIADETAESQGYNDDLAEQFDSGKPSCSDSENDQELKRDIATEELDWKTRFEDSDVSSDKEPDHVSKHVLNSADVGENAVEKVSEHGGSSEGVHVQVEESEQEVGERMSIDPSVNGPACSENEENKENCNSQEEKALENGNSKEQFGKDLTLDEEVVSKVGDMIETTEHPEFCVVDDTTIKLGQEAELSYKNQEIVEKSAMTPHGHTEERSDDCITGESLKDSLDQTASCSSDDDTIVDLIGNLKEVITGEDNKLDQSLTGSESENVMANVENKMANAESNNESCDELQHDSTDVSHSSTIDNTGNFNESVRREEGTAFGSLEKESVAENTSESEVKKISPRLRERASSLLSALKDDITGANSKDIQSEQSSTNFVRDSGVDDTKCTEPDATSNDISASDTQERTNSEKCEL